MSNSLSSEYQKKILTLPSVLSMLRICWIPIVVWLYVYKKQYLLTLRVLMFSGLTDIVDGFIACKFNIISDFGKILDLLMNQKSISFLMK